MPKTILITGANGNVSSALIASLKGSKNSVRAMVRNPEKAGALKAQGVEVVVGDFDRPKTLGKVFEGVDSAWVLTANGPTAAVHSCSALWAARQAGVSHVVRMSAVGAAHNAHHQQSPARPLRCRARGLGHPYTILKPHFFCRTC